MISFLLSHSTSNPLADSVSSTLKTNLAPDHFLSLPPLSPSPCHHLLFPGLQYLFIKWPSNYCPPNPFTQSSQSDLFKHKSDHISVALKPSIGFLGLQLRISVALKPSIGFRGLQLRIPPSLEYDQPLPPSLTSSWIFSQFITDLQLYCPPLHLF